MRGLLKRLGMLLGAMSPRLARPRMGVQADTERSPEEKALIEFYSEAARTFGPCERPAAEEAVAKLYEQVGKKRPLFIWFDSPVTACRVVILWDLMEAMLSVGKPTRQNVLLFSGETLRSSVLEHQNSLSQQLLEHTLGPISDAIRDVGAPVWTLLSFVGMNEIARTHHEFPAHDVQSTLSHEFRHGYPLDAWFEQWQKFRELLIEIGGPAAETLERWDALANVFWSLSDDEQRGLLLRCLNAEARSMWLPDATNVPNFPRPFGMNWGNGDAEPILYAEIIRLAIHRDDDMQALREMVCHCGWWRAEESVCFMVDRPTVVELDDVRRLHGRLEYADGFRLFALHGVRVSEEIATGQFSAHDIDAMNNVEVRRVMIDMFGAEKYLLETNAEVIHRDEFGVLYRKNQIDDEPLVMVKVQNSTAEPDGTFRNYFLRVPPDMRTAREAIAWTFGLNAKDYKPSKET